MKFGIAFNKTKFRFLTLEDTLFTRIMLNTVLLWQLCFTHETLANFPFTRMKHRDCVFVWLRATLKGYYVAAEDIYDWNRTRSNTNLTSTSQQIFRCPFSFIFLFTQSFFIKFITVTLCCRPYTNITDVSISEEWITSYCYLL